MSNEQTDPQVLKLDLPPEEYEGFAALAARLGHTPDELATKLCTDFLRTCQGPKPQEADDYPGPLGPPPGSEGAKRAEAANDLFRSKEDMPAE